MKIYIETYGCRMNICDSEILLSILASEGHVQCEDIDRADVIILNSCSVRETGHEKTYSRLDMIRENHLDDRIVVICGCFATQLDRSVFDKYPFLDIVISPDMYRRLPSLIRGRASGVMVQGHDEEEMYADIVPVRTIEDRTTAAVTVMKGCNQYCSYCIEPFTRGREHSRDIGSVLSECKRIENAGYKELTFVGHIIDRYGYGFAMLLDRAAELCPGLRIKFLSSHPLTFSDDMIDVIRRHENIMRVVHLPVQSGSDSVLYRMNRGYTVEQYRAKYLHIKEAIPDMSIVTDVMVGFCGETDDDFRQTADLVDELRFDDINVFSFSMRKGTVAYGKYRDDIPEDIKSGRSDVIKDLRDRIRYEKYSTCLGQLVTVYNEGPWPADPGCCFGRDNYLRTVVFRSDKALPVNMSVPVRIRSVSARNLYGDAEWV